MRTHSGLPQHYYQETVWYEFMCVNVFLTTFFIYALYEFPMGLLDRVYQCCCHLGYWQVSINDIIIGFTNVLKITQAVSRTKPHLLTRYGCSGVGNVERQHLDQLHPGLHGALQLGRVQFGRWLCQLHTCQRAGLETASTR